MRPSTYAGTPVTMDSGGVPMRSTGQFFLTSSWFAPMPPEVTMTALARSSKSPTVSRDEATPRAAAEGSSSDPRTPTAAPSSTINSSTWCRYLKSTSPRSAAASTGSRKTRTTSGPVPHVMWKRGTEFPCPVAVPEPRSAHPTFGVTFSPRPCR